MGAWSASAAVLAVGVLAILAVVSVGRLPLRPLRVNEFDRTSIRSVLTLIASDRVIRSIPLLTTLSMSAFGGTALVAVGLAERSGRASDAGSLLILSMAIGSRAAVAAGARDNGETLEHGEREDARCPAERLDHQPHTDRAECRASDLQARIERPLWVASGRDRIVHIRNAGDRSGRFDRAHVTISRRAA